MAINDVGVIVGFASGLDNVRANAFVYADGVMTNIHPTTESYARDINNRLVEKNEIMMEFALRKERTTAMVKKKGMMMDLVLKKERTTAKPLAHL